MTGTPLMTETRSVSIRRNASPASHLYMCTSVPPASVVMCAMQLFAVTWKSGVTTRTIGA